MTRDRVESMPTWQPVGLVYRIHETPLRISNRCYCPNAMSFADNQQDRLMVNVCRGGAIGTS